MCYWKGATVNTSSNGVVEVVSFGLVRFMEAEITYQTDKDIGSSGDWETDLQGQENVRNFHTNDKRRIDVEVIVDYRTDILQAKKVLQKVISNFPMVLQAPASDVLIQDL